MPDDVMMQSLQSGKWWFLGIMLIPFVVALVIHITRWGDKKHRRGYYDSRLYH
jgi:hypothetical protein